MTAQTLAFVGTAGGVGTTRLTVEAGATLARDGNDVAIFDSAYTTQQLAAYIDGPIEQDVTALVTGTGTLEDSLYDLETSLPGQVAVCPAWAPFERLARAKTAGAAESLERQIAAASLSYDYVLVDTPPIGANQALAAVNAVDRIALVATDSERGRDAIALMEERLEDIGSQADSIIANRTTEPAAISPAVAIPTSDVTKPRKCPAVVSPDSTFAPAVAAAVEQALAIELDLEFPDGSRISSFVSSND